MIPAILTLVLLLAGSPLAIAQGRPSRTDGGTLPASFGAASGLANVPSRRITGPTAAVMIGDSLLESFTFDQGGDTSVIVLFRDPPIAVRTELRKDRTGRQSAAAMDALHALHDRFRTDLQGIEASAAAGAISSSGVRYEYFEALDGMALRMARPVIAEVRNLPYVAGVYVDGMVTALDDASNTVIGAPAFWSAYGAQGENIDIAILDTGIDYLHEALGGAPFPNAKVVGGSDIVNNDDDPMDDHGHGTHVAGIAAGDGPAPKNLRGVAPKARLWAFKVLNAQGRGSSSQVIAGIEKALDPDGDPSTPTPIEVISMSLGGSGDPGDPLSQAVDNAAASGVVCAVAAGNDGPAYQSIESPGCARGALTVGASTNLDAVASFSSRGGTDLTFAIKPDVMAPGSQITSAKLGGGYVALSGTSMATPHVAGAAALLRELHPEWTAAEVKAALMESAHDLGLNVWTQGSGRIDLPRAGARMTDVTPGSVSLGMVQSAIPLWTHSDTLTLHNHRGVPLTFSLSLLTLPPAGVGIALQPSLLALAPGDSGTVEVTTTVDNTVYGYPTGTPQAFEDRVVIQSDSAADRMSVPIAFIKAPFMKLRFDQQPILVFIQNRKGKYVLKGGTLPDSLIVILPNDTYDVLVDFDFAHTVLRENVSHAGTTVLDISASEATHKITLRTNDLGGANLAFGNNIFTRHIIPRGSVKTDLTVGWLFIGYPYETPFFISDVSPDYTFFSKVSSVFPSGAFASIPFLIAGGIAGDKNLQNDASKWREVDYRHYAPPGLGEIHVFNETNGWFTQVLAPPFRASSFFAPVSAPDSVPDALSSYLYGHQTVSTGPDPFFGGDPVLYRTGFILPRDPGTLEFYNDGDFGDPLATSTATPLEIAVGEGAPLWTARTWNTGPSISLVPSQPNAKGYFVSQYGDLMFGLFPYGLFQGDSLLRSGTLLNGYCLSGGACPGDPQGIANVLPGHYALRASCGNYTLGGVKGVEHVALEFDMGGSDKNPPYLRNMTLRSGGKITNVLPDGADNEVRLTVSDASVTTASGVATVALSMRSLGDASWQALGLARAESLYDATIPGNLPGGAYAMRIVAHDSAGNALDYSIEPAFVVPGAAFSATRFEFGEVSAACRATRRFTITNTDSTNELTVGAIVSDNPAFAVSADSGTIAPLASATFEITFHPSGAGQVSGAIAVAHSGKAAPDTLYVSGTGIAAPAGAISLAVSYGPDWQLVSLPVAGCPYAMSPLYGFSSSYVPFETLTNGSGYWAKPAGQAMVFTGYPVTVETTHVSRGWNIVGSITDSVPVAGLVTLPPGILASAFFGFDTTYYIADAIAPGRAYWVKVAQDGALVLRKGSGGPSFRAGADEILARARSLSITDGLGRTVRLYLIDAAVAGAWPERLTLPPVPPGDPFDARFSSGQLLAASSGEADEEFPIAVTAKHYPLRFSLSGPSDATAASLEAGNEAFDLRPGAVVELDRPVAQLRLSLHGGSSVPAHYGLSQNYPNPFNPTTTISYALPRPSQVRMELFNTLGERVATLVDAREAAGIHAALFDAGALPSGVYFYRLTAGSFTEVKKMLLMR